MLDYYQTAIMFGKAPKLILHFKVTSFGEGFGSWIPRYYNVQKLIGKGKKKWTLQGLKERRLSQRISERCFQREQNALTDYR